MNYHGHDHNLGPIEQEVASLFSNAGWSVSAGKFADLTIRKRGLVYAVQIKRASEGRADRLIPLLSQAVLEARAHAQQTPKAMPLVVVVGKSFPRKVVAQVEIFARTYAPDVAVGLMDSRGLADFSGTGLEKLSRVPSVSGTTSRFVMPRPVHLFSDLGQWLFKVLLAADLADERLLNAPVMRYRNASELARGARVSTMTAFRFLQELKSNGFVDEESDVVRLVRLEELLDRWKSAADRPGVSVAAKWLFASEKPSQIKRVSQALGDEGCVAFYAAADALGFGIARGVPTHFYVARIPDDIGRSLGLARVAERSEADAVFRIPGAKESVFRGAVAVNGIRSCDVLQAWLDVGHDASRGQEQADHLYRRVIRPMIRRASR